MNTLLLALACLFAWCALTAGHAEYHLDPAPATAISTTQP